MKKVLILAVALVASVISTTGFAQGTKMVGGAEMYPSKDIVAGYFRQNLEFLFLL